MKNRQHKQKPPCGAVCKKPFCGAVTPYKKAFQRQHKKQILLFKCIMLTAKSQVLRTGKAPDSGLVWGINIPTIIDLLSHRYIEGDREKKRKEYPHAIDTQKGGGRCLNGKRRLIVDRIERLT